MPARHTGGRGRACSNNTITLHRCSGKAAGAATNTIAHRAAPSRRTFLVAHTHTAPLRPTPLAQRTRVVRREVVARVAEGAGPNFGVEVHGGIGVEQGAARLAGHRIVLDNLEAGRRAGADGGGRRRCRHRPPARLPARLLLHRMHRPPAAAPPPTAHPPAAARSAWLACTARRTGSRTWLPPAGSAATRSKSCALQQGGSRGRGGGGYCSRGGTEADTGRATLAASAGQ